MKKNIFGLATGFIVALSLTACGETPAPEAPSPKPSVTTQPKAATPTEKMKSETTKTGDVKKAGEAKGTTGEMGKKAGEAKGTTGDAMKATPKTGDATKATPEAVKKN